MKKNTPQKTTSQQTTPKTITPETFSTKDLATAAAISCFQKPIRTEKQGRSIYFYFDKEAEKIAQAFWSNDLQGNLATYSNCMKALKDWIFAALRQDDLQGENNSSKR
jgi:hypothetical protein